MLAIPSPLSPNLLDALGGVGSAIPVRSWDDIQRIESRMRQQQYACDQQQSMLNMQSQQMAMVAQLAAQQSFANAALAVSEAERARRHKYFLKSQRTREQHRRRNWMRITKSGYRARERCEVALWIAVGTILLGGVALPVGLRVYTSLWMWALGGGG